MLLPGIIVLLVISEAINANYKPELGLMKKDDERERKRENNYEMRERENNPTNPQLIVMIAVEFLKWGLIIVDQRNQELCQH